jgi:hypothetical protein
MTDAKGGRPTPSLTEIRALAETMSLPLTDAEIGKVAGAVASLRESAARVREGLSRNDEPAFAFRHPLPSRKW